VYDIESIQLSYILCDEQDRKVQLKLISYCPPHIFILYAVPQVFKIYMPLSHCFLKLVYFRKAYSNSVFLVHEYLTWEGKAHKKAKLGPVHFDIILYKKGPCLSHFYFFSIWPLLRCRSVNSDTFLRYLFSHQFQNQTELSPLLYYVHMVISLTFYQVTPSFPTRLPSCHTKAWTKNLSIL